MKSLMVTSRHIYFLQCSLFGEVDFVDLEARVLFPLLWVLSFEWIRWFGFRGKFIFYSGLPFGGRSHFGGVDLLDSEACEFIFYSALPVVESILWTLRHEFICFPSGGCSLSDRVVVFDSEADLFLQCSPFGGVDLLDPEARIYFLQWITL